MGGNACEHSCFFWDEINTSSCMGTFKGIVMDRMVDGRALPSNVTIVAACNPARSLATVQGGVIRQDDLGKDWALGHYQGEKCKCSNASRPYLLFIVRN